MDNTTLQASHAGEDLPRAVSCFGREIIPALVPSLVISAGATAWCGWAAGGGLGLFLSSALLAATYVPALTLAEKRFAKLAAALGCVVGTSIVWSILKDDVSLWQWLRCALVLATYVWALAGVAALVARCGVGVAAASGVTVFLAMLWATWPVWLSHALTQTLADWLTPAHPLMAINGVLKHLGSWDRTAIAYRTLTTLNQDVSYRLPGSIVPAVLLHAAIGAPGMFLALRSPARPAEDSTSANRLPMPEHDVNA